MTATALRQKVSEKLDLLPPEDLRKVLNLAEELAKRQTLSGGDPRLLPFAQGFAQEDLEALRQAEEDCEKVDLSEW